jgi:tetratricopeptide (TPR) repeat protein
MLHRDSSVREPVKIVDFGIAKFLDGGGSHALKYSPRDSQVVGSPLYMSPEQCMGDRNLDGRSDIYSLGCLLYQVLTGRPPFAEETVLGIIYAHINQLPIPFATVVPNLKLPTQLEDVVFKALNKNPHKRQQSMRELKEELQAAARSLEQAPNVVPEPVAFLQKLADIEAGSPQLVPHLHDLADFYRANRQPERAEEHLREAVACLADAFGTWDLRVAEAVKKLADFYRSSMRYKEAEPLYHDLLLIKQKEFGENHPDVPLILLRLAEIYFKTGRNNKALRYYMRCLRISERLFGPNDPVLTPILTGLGSTLRRLSREDEAEEVYRRALSVEELNLGPDHYEVASTLVGLGVVYRFREKYIEAETALRRALEIYEQTVGSYHHNVASVLLLLAELYSVQGYDGTAQDLYDRALKIRESSRESHFDIPAAYNVWAAHYLRRADVDSAESVFKKLLTKESEAGPSQSLDAPT